MKKSPKDAKGAKGNKRSLDSGAQKRRASARDDKNRGELLYLYGISESAAEDVRMEGVEAIACGGLVCWVSRVDAKEYGEELQARMENLDWLAGASVRHQRVVSAIHEKTTMLPARFATLFVSEESLRADVTRRERQLRSDLRRVRGADEYGIKIFALAKAVAPVAGSSGRDYLQKKSQLLRQTSTPAMSAAAEEFISELRQIANESAAGGSVSGGQRNLVWQGSFLIGRTERKRLESALGQFHRRHGDEFRIECTGPWPPYSFIAARGKAE